MLLSSETVFSSETVEFVLALEEVLVGSEELVLLLSENVSSGFVSVDCTSLLMSVSDDVEVVDDVDDVDDVEVVVLDGKLEEFVSSTDLQAVAQSIIAEQSAKHNILIFNFLILTFFVIFYFQPDYTDNHNNCYQTENNYTDNNNNRENIIVCGARLLLI